MPSGISGVGPAVPPPPTPESTSGIMKKVKDFFNKESSTLPKSPKPPTAPKPKVPILLRLGISVFGAGLFISPLGLGAFVVGAALFGLASTNTAGRFFHKTIVKPLNIVMKKCFEPSVEKLKKMDINQLNAVIPKLTPSTRQALGAQLTNETINQLNIEAISSLVSEPGLALKFAGRFRELVFELEPPIDNPQLLERAKLALSNACKTPESKTMVIDTLNITKKTDTLPTDHPWHGLLRDSKAAHNTLWRARSEITVNGGKLGEISLTDSDTSPVFEIAALCEALFQKVKQKYPEWDDDSLRRTIAQAVCVRAIEYNPIDLVSKLNEAYSKLERNDEERIYQEPSCSGFEFRFFKNQNQYTCEIQLNGTLSVYTITTHGEKDTQASISITSVVSQTTGPLSDTNWPNVTKWQGSLTTHHPVT